MLSLLSRGTRPAFAASFGAASPSEVLPTAFQKGGGGLLTAPKSTLTIHALIFHFFFSVSRHRFEDFSRCTG